MIFFLNNKAKQNVVYFSLFIIKLRINDATAERRRAFRSTYPDILSADKFSFMQCNLCFPSTLPMYR